MRFLPFTDLLSNIVDNRGRTCPVAESGIPLIATNCVKNCGLFPTFEKVRYVDENTYKTWFRGHPKPGDLVFVTKGSPGQVCLVPDPVPFCIAQDMVAIRANPDVVYPNYLFAALRSPDVQKAISNMHVGTLIPHFKKGDFSKLSIPVPEMPLQQIVGDTFIELSTKIELNRRMNATLESIARALFRDWLVDFGPTRAKMEGRETYLSPDLWSLFPDRLDSEGKPEGWQQKPLTAFFSIIGGGTPKTSNSAFWNGNIPWFSVTDTPAPGSVFVTDTEKTITEAGLNGSSARMICKGTTIISARGTVGNLAVAGRDMTFNQSCYGLKAAAPVGDYATYLIAQNMVNQLKSMAHGSVFSTITRQTFESLSLPMPTPDLLSAFEDTISPLFERILANVEESRTLALTRDLLLPRLMSGELRVDEAERLASKVA
ncbi:restriction endonuclease subunit S [Paracoccus sanguinis]|uniref:restriction endonuclease subunit S n=1 Tax=Paracoccus sanguinis TaxID=1545044 RepID=UPI0009DE7E69|nr:restriction endonuclease subunit S [Paracoccus sanguinis]